MTSISSSLVLFLQQALSYISRDQTRELVHTSRAIRNIVAHAYDDRCTREHPMMRTRTLAFVDPLERVLARSSLTSLTTSLITIEPDETCASGSIFIHPRDYVLSYARIEFVRLCRTCPQKILARICYRDDVEFARHAMNVIEYYESYYTDTNIDDAIGIFDHAVPQLERTRCENDISRNNTPSARTFAFLVHHIVADRVIRQISIRDDPNVDMSIVCALTISAMHANNVALLESLARTIRPGVVYDDLSYASSYRKCAYVTNEVESVIMANERLRDLVQPIMRSLEHPMNRKDYATSGITYDLRAITLFKIDDEDYCLEICDEHESNNGDYRDIVELSMVHEYCDIFRVVICDTSNLSIVADYFDTSIKSRPQDIIDKVLSQVFGAENVDSMYLLFGTLGVFARLQYPVKLLRALIDNAYIDYNSPNDTRMNAIAQILKTMPDYDLSQLYVPNVAYLDFYRELGISPKILLTGPNVISIINNARDIGDVLRVARYMDFCDMECYSNMLEQYYTCEITNMSISVYAIHNNILPRFLPILRDIFYFPQTNPSSRVLFIFGVIFNDDQAVAKALQMGYVVEPHNKVAISLSHILVATDRARVTTNKHDGCITIDLMDSPDIRT